MARQDSRDDDARYASRPYRDMPSVTPRAWGRMTAEDDSFGPRELGGYGDFREAAARDGARRRDERASQRGRGPRQARPDGSIADEVFHRLTWDESVDAGQILMSVADGVVTLTGEVPERAMKRRAEDIVAEVRGVRDVENRIRVDDGRASFGPGGAVRSGRDQLGSGFSSSERTQEDWAEASVRHGRAGHENLEPEQQAADRKS